MGNGSGVEGKDYSLKSTPHVEQRSQEVPRGGLDSTYHSGTSVIRYGLRRVSGGSPSLGM